jgi:hypothetical protein
VKPEERSLTDYLEDIHQIRETMLRAENRLHVPSWFFFVVAGLVAAGTGVHALVAFMTPITLTTALLAIWLPVFLLAGVAETAAWIEKGRSEGLPWLSPSVGRFFATIGGIMVAVIVVSIAALSAGYSAAGIVLIVAGSMFLAYSPYSPSAALWTGWVLLAPGLGLLLASISGPATTLGAAGLVVAAFVVNGIAERSRPQHE